MKTKSKKTKSRPASRVSPRPPASRAAAEQAEDAYAYHAFKMKQGAHEFFVTSVPIDDLYPYAFVDRRDENPTTGFQRVCDESRAKDIAEYLKTYSIPQSLVLSAQPHSALQFNRNMKAVTFSREANSFLVLDGQHRLLGYQLCETRHRVPCSIYVNLSRAEETALFLDINTKQKGVSSSLILDIKAQAQVENAREVVLRELYDKLSTDKRSPFVDRMSPTGIDKTKLSRVTFNRAIGPMLNSKTLDGLDGEAKYKIVRNFFSAVHEEFKTARPEMAESMFRATFLAPICDVMDDVVNTTVDAHGNARPDSLRLTVRPMAALEYSATTLGGSLNRKSILQAMRASLRGTVEISDEML